jgi:hypothetical protein
VALLKQVKGVGTLIALTFLLTLEDAHRFRKSRDVGCYLGLQPRRRNFGQREPQMHISKEGDPYLRTLLVQGAHSGTVRRRLRSAALGPEAGRARREKRQEASHHCHREKACGVAASLVGERRSIRTAAQPPAERDAGGSIKPKHSKKGKGKSPKPSSGDCVYRLAQLIFRDE